eukprot:120045-Pleurochrysis_carterae.AAC.1
MCKSTLAATIEHQSTCIESDERRKHPFRVDVKEPELTEGRAVLNKELDCGERSTCLRESGSTR